jgi:hypothetical protein
LKTQLLCQLTISLTAGTAKMSTQQLSAWRMNVNYPGAGQFEFLDEQPDSW